MTETIHFELDGDGIATLTIDVPGQSMNVIGAQFLADLDALINRLAAEEAIAGAVIASGKASGFMAGMDLKAMETMLLPRPGEPLDMAALFTRCFELNRILRRLETCGKPVACAIEGTCVGGGFELALACHRRIVSDNAKTQLGLPEILVGLFPGGGGSQRFPRITGVQTALMTMLQGKLFRPAEGAAMKLIDEVVPAGTALEAAKAWVKANPSASVQPWDQKGYKVPGGAGSMNPNFVQTFVGAVPMTVKQTQRNLNGPIALLSAVYEGLQLPMDRAIRVESKYFAKVIADPQARNMVRTLFVNKQAAERGARRPAAIPPSPTKKLAMLGAGMMGAGIATVAAQAGIEVMLLDRDMAAAEKEGARLEAVRIQAEAADARGLEAAPHASGFGEGQQLAHALRIVGQRVDVLIAITCAAQPVGAQVDAAERVEAQPTAGALLRHGPQQDRRIGHSARQVHDHRAVREGGLEHQQQVDRVGQQLAGRIAQPVQVNNQVAGAVDDAAGLFQGRTHAAGHRGGKGDVEGGAGDRDKPDVQGMAHGWVPCR